MQCYISNPVQCGWSAAHATSIQEEIDIVSAQIGQDIAVGRRSPETPEQASNLGHLNSVIHRLLPDGNRIRLDLAHAQTTSMYRHNTPIS